MCVWTIPVDPTSQGCELGAYEGSEELLRAHVLPILKMYYNPIIQETMGSKGAAHDVLHILHKNDYVILTDQFPEMSMYYGAHGAEIFDVDYLFGSQRFNVPGSEDHRVKMARALLKSKIDHDTVLKGTRGGKDMPFTDIIAIARPVYEKLCRHFFPDEYSSPAGSRNLRATTESNMQWM